MPTVNARPVRATRVAWILAVLVVVVFTAVATTLRGPTESGKSVFQASDQYAMIGLGVLAALAILMFTRCPARRPQGRRRRIGRVRPAGWPPRSQFRDGSRSTTRRVAPEQ